jgi:hypothetical protein
MLAARAAGVTVAPDGETHGDPELLNVWVPALRQHSEGIVRFARREGGPMITSTADWAVRYIQAYQFKLVSIPRGCKGPIGNEWNKRGRYVEDVEKAKLR